MSKVLRQITSKNNIPVKLKGNIRCLNVAHNKFAKQINKYKSYNINATKQYLLPTGCISYKRFYSSDYPSHNKILLPALSPTMEMGTIISWAKQEGDKLNEGDLLAEIETDKATMGFETPEEGYLAKILIPAGTRDVPVGKLVCIIVENEDDVAAFKNFVDDLASAKVAEISSFSSPPLQSASTQSQSLKTPLSPTQSSQPSIQPFISKSNDRIFVSPLAKRLAAEQGIDLTSINQGTGIFGSIKAKDLNKASAIHAVDSKSKGVKSVSLPREGHEDKSVSSVRKVIAKRLIQSKQTIPHYYLNVDLNMDEIIKLRKKLNEDLEKDGIKLTINDFIIKATALACKKIPEVNSSWMDTFIRQYFSVDVSVAVSTEKGLITPIVFDAEKKGLIEISLDVKHLATKAREGSLQPNEFQGGTISVSNLGMFNIKSVSSIINPPHACILGIGSIQQRLVPDETSSNGTKISKIVQFTLSCDHRVVDGAVGAQWLNVFRKLIEQPQNMLL